MKKFIKIIVFILGLVAINYGISYLVTDNSGSYTRAAFHELYNSDENIDVVFAGSSHCYRSVDPQIIDKETGFNSFNIGSSSQKIDGCYYFLNECFKTNQIKKVYLELNPWVLANGQKKQELTSTYILTDYMKPSLDKLKFLLDVTTEEDWINNLFLSRRNFHNIYDPGYIAGTVNHKNTEEYKNFAPLKFSNEVYKGKGFVSSFDAIPEKGAYVKYYNDAKTDKYTDYSLDYLNKIVELCKNQNTELVLWTAPITDALAESYGKYNTSDTSGRYDDAITYFANYAKKNELQYFNFNLAKETFLQFSDSDFKDKNHLNGVGAEKLSYKFAEIIKSPAIVNKNNFYSSWNEKRASNPENYGLVVQKTKNKNMHSIKINPLSSVKNQRMEYKITIPLGKQKECTYQNYSANTIIPLKNIPSSQIRIYARPVGSSTDTSIVTINIK